MAGSALDQVDVDRSVQNGGGPMLQLGPPALLSHLEDVRTFCARFSEMHRSSMPTDIIESRLAEVVRTVGDVFQDRVMQICFLLDHHGVLRFNELMKVLPHMSSRTLTNKLSMLQERGLIVRTMYDENPPRVEYRLTARGKGLVDLLFPAIVHVTWIARKEEGRGR